jgi:hypothetical protein
MSKRPIKVLPLNLDQIRNPDNRGFPSLSDGSFEKNMLKALEEKYLPAPRPNTSEKLWISKDGRETPISEMATRHLINTIRMIEDGRHGRIKPDTVDSKNWLQTLRADLDWRKNLVNRFKKKEKRKRRSPGGIFYET